MASTHQHSDDCTSAVLDHEACQAFTSDEASSLLRMLGQADHSDERTYSSVSMFQLADGHHLYILPH
ncbi:hypothetical protein MASR1M60_21630 [Rhodocyclaceae bacterium]